MTATRAGGSATAIGLKSVSHFSEPDGLDDATEDLCLFTTTDPIAGVPSKSLGQNRWAEMDGNASLVRRSG